MRNDKIKVSENIKKDAVPVYIMMKFNILTIEQRDLLLKYLEEYKFNTYEYSFLTLFLWRDYCQVEWCIYKDALILKKKDYLKGAYFMQPLGISPQLLPELIEKLNAVRQRDPSFKVLFGDVEEPFLLQLKDLYGNRIKFIEDKNNYDYIYDTQKLINLTGKKLHKKKNLYNQFIRKYEYTIKDIHNQETHEECICLAENWLQNQKIKYEELVFELEGIKKVFHNLDKLNVLGMAVYVKDQIAGFTLGEKVNDKMAIIHVEKADLRYKGIYAFLNKTFVENYLHDTLFINREEDLGISGLRKAKLAYEPVKFVKKYLVDIGIN